MKFKKYSLQSIIANKAHDSNRIRTCINREINSSVIILFDSTLGTGGIGDKY